MLVKDLNPGLANSNPGNLTNVGGTLFFTAFNPTSGTELWKSDGTAAGTQLVRDLAPGTGSSNPANLTVMGGLLFFTANNGFNGNELWLSDGTAEATLLVKDINPGFDGSSPSNLTVVGDTLFFIAFEPASGTELWKTDGITLAGTKLVKDIQPGISSSAIANLTSVGGTLFFTAVDGSAGTGIELWKSDGTTAGTVLVKDIRPGTTSSNPTNLVNVDGTLFFSADDGLRSRELWRSDGTAAGTVLVKDIFFGGGGSYPTNLVNVGGTLFFTANNGFTGAEVWRSDGTFAGTVLVRDINAGSIGPLVASLTPVGNTLYFTALDPAAGQELWRSDGTTAGTFLVTDIFPGIGSALSFFTNPFLTEAGGSLFFAATNGVNGIELWRLDPACVPEVRILDDGDAGFSATAGFIPFFSQGLQADVAFAAPGAGSETATWTFTNLTPGLYRISATWSADPNRATDAPFTLLNGTSVLATVRLNQQQAPNDFTAQGATWEDLGTFTVTAGTLVVQLTDDANGFIIADSVRVERIGDVPAVQIVDDGSPQFSATGFTSFAGQGFGGDVSFAEAGDGSAAAAWTFAVAPGTYRVSVTWTAHENRATNATFTVFDGDAPFKAAVVNQQLAPVGLSAGGVMFQDLGGPHVITGTALVVRLTNLADGFVIADAIRIERLE